MIASMKSMLYGGNCLPTSSGRSTLEDKHSGMKVSVSDIPCNSLVIKIPDKNKAHMAIVKDREGYKAFCDFLILTAPHDNEVVDVYFVEMKKTARLNSGGVPYKACKQIISTLPIFEYLREMVEVHHSKTPKITQHFVIISEKRSGRLDKQNVKAKASKETKFEGSTFKIIWSNRVSYNQLKCQHP